MNTEDRLTEIEYELMAARAAGDEEAILRLENEQHCLSEYDTVTGSVAEAFRRLG